MKMIEITYRQTCWSDKKFNKETKDWEYTLLIDSPEERKVLINIELIASISPTPVVGHEGDKTENLYFVNTQIAYSRGINGADYRGYYVTEATYQKLIKNIEVLG